MAAARSSGTSGKDGEGSGPPSLPKRAPLRQSTKSPKPYRRNGIEFLHEDFDYNVAQFYEQFSNNLPQMVVVSQGFCGDIIEDIFDRGQVLRLNAVSKQRRVVAKFQYLSESRLISIPESYNQKLCIVKRSGKYGKPEDIYTILKECSLPLTVQFPKDQKISVGSQTMSSNNIPNIELMQSFDEIYLLGNFISNSELNEDVVAVPLYLSHLRLSRITGIKGQTKGQWDEYQERMVQITSYIEYDLQFGNQNIAEYDPNAVHSDAIYTYVEPRLYSNIFKLVHSTPTRALETTHYSPYDSRHCNSRHDDNADGYADLVETVTGSATYCERTTTTKEQEKPDFINELETALKPGRKQADMPKHVSSRLSSPEPQLNKGPPVTRQKPQTEEKYPYAVSDPGIKIGASLRSHNTQPHTASRALYANDIPRTTISPTMQETSRQTSAKAVNPRKLETVTPELKSLEDVAKLTIDDVTECLKKLKLEKYVEVFKEQLIDGRMLTELDKTILKEEFGMTVIEGLRLMNFAKDGHIPK